MYVPRNLTERFLKTAGCPMVFVHTPKCGGKYVSQAFGRRFDACVTMTDPQMRGHQTWRNYRVGFSRHGLDIRDFCTFGLVRNPWRWHQSWYSYVKKDKGGRHSGMPVEHALFQNITFLDYLRWLDNPGITGLQNRYYLRQMSDWLVGGDGQICVDHVLRCETLASDMTTLSDTYGLRLSLPRKRVNQSHSDVNPDVTYCAEGIEIVRRRHARDIELFGYTFEDQAANEMAVG
ncbi:MAG: hypothetical protein ACSHXB_05845 [Sulfitobacter sp.]